MAHVHVLCVKPGQGKESFKRAPRCYCILILWGFSPGQLLIRAPPERIDIWSLWENVNDYLGNPLYPMPTILLSSLTIHAPTCTGILDSSCFYFPKRAYLCCRILAPHGGEEGHCKEVLGPLQVFFPGLLGEHSQKKYGIYVNFPQMSDMPPLLEMLTILPILKW